MVGSALKVVGGELRRVFAIGGGRFGVGWRRREKTGPGVKLGPGLSGPGAAGFGGVSGGRERAEVGEWRGPGEGK